MWNWYEIETAVERGLREHLGSRGRLAVLLGLNETDDAEVLQKIVAVQNDIPMARFVEDSIERITLHPGKLEIRMKAEALARIVSEGLNIAIPEIEKDKTATLTAPYKIRRTRKNAILLAPEKPEPDIFDLPPDKLKKLVQGVVWWQEHLSGKTLTDIAGAENCSDAHVGKSIFWSFDLLQNEFPALAR